MHRINRSFCAGRPYTPACMLTFNRKQSVTVSPSLDMEQPLNWFRCCDSRPSTFEMATSWRNPFETEEIKKRCSPGVWFISNGSPLSWLFLCYAFVSSIAYRQSSWTTLLSPTCIKYISITLSRIRKSHLDPLRSELREPYCVNYALEADTKTKKCKKILYVIPMKEKGKKEGCRQTTV